MESGCDVSAIVTNARNRIAYNVVRSLGQKGIAVYAADFVPRSMTFASRYVSGHFVYPSPFREPDAFVTTLLEQAERCRAKVLIPVFEETFLVAKHQARLAERLAVAVPNYAQILTAHNKDTWSPLAASLGIPVPATYTIDEARQAGPGDLPFPLLIKPKQGGGAWGITEVGSRAALQEVLARSEWSSRPWGRFFVQQKIQGRTHCVAMLFSHGAHRATVGYQQLRDYPVTGGQATLRVSVREPQAEEYLRRLLEHLRWHGTCQADFIIDDTSGTPYLIDLNPRLWGSLAQAIASGVDFPHLIYRLALEGDVPAVESFKTGVVTRWIGGELAALPARVRRSPERWRLLREFLLPERRSAMYDDFSSRDPMPFVVWTLDAVSRAVRFRSTAPVSHDSLEGIWE
jgi:predicted ATP-grasp superfamily ATP-dependent carboligase